MLVTADLRAWLIKAKINWNSAARENGNQTGDWGCDVFSDIFKVLIQVIAGMELLAIRPGKYVCDLCADDSMLQIIWFEPPVNGCCVQGYDVCHLTKTEIDSAVSLEQLWRLFVANFEQGLRDQIKVTSDEIEYRQSQLENFNTVLQSLSRLL